MRILFSFFLYVNNSTVRFYVTESLLNIVDRFKCRFFLDIKEAPHVVVK